MLLTPHPARMHSTVSLHGRGTTRAGHGVLAMHTSISAQQLACAAPCLRAGWQRRFRSLNLCDAGAQAFCVLWAGPSRGPMGSRVAGATPLARAEGVNTRTVKPRVRVAKS